MTTSYLHLPHPFLAVPVLYVADVPAGVKWPLVQALLSSCGPVQLGGKVVVPGTNRKRWKVIFSSIISTEMALATLSGIHVAKGVKFPPWQLLLSHSPLLDEVLPNRPVLPLFLRQSDSGQPFRLSYDAQAIFWWFRRAGPLVSIRLNVDIGYEDRACVIQYWEEEHAIFARSQGPEIHPSARTLRFTLQAYNPWNLYVTNLSPGITTQELKAHFAKYGQILSTSVIGKGKVSVFGFVSFSTREEAQKAKDETNGCKLGDSEVVIRYHELKATNNLRPHPDARETPIRSPDIIGATTKYAKARRERARCMETLTATQEAHAIIHEKEKSDAFVLAEKADIEAKETITLAMSAVQNAQRTLQLAQDHLSQSLEQAARATSCKQKAREDLDAATKNKEDAVSRAEAARNNSQHARREERRLRGLDPDGASDSETNQTEHTEEAEEPDDQTKRGKEEDEAEHFDTETEELRRQDRLEREAKAREAELHESLRKMAQFEAEEKRRKQEKEEAEKQAREAAQRAKEERERKEREEAERRVREAREKEQREKREAQERITRYHTAAAKERTRCKLRDEVRWKKHIPWTPFRSIERFRIISDEFDDIKFKPEQPLTFESIPWPTLHSPYKVKFDDIDWQAVEEFFKKLQLTTDVDDYRISVEKAHRRFHPDKWRSRGLLNTILDDNLRGMVEKTGNIVAQALTPIWLESRSK